MNNENKAKERLKKELRGIVIDTAFKTNNIPYKGDMLDYEQEVIETFEKPILKIIEKEMERAKLEGGLSALEKLLLLPQSQSLNNAAVKTIRDYIWQYELFLSRYE